MEGEFIMKKKIATLLVAAMLTLSLAACSKGGSSDTSSTNDKGSDITTIRFYGSDSEYNQNIVAGFEKENPDIKVEIVPVDFDNAEKVIKTGIASGDPVDVSFYWGTNINAFVDNDMAYDFTADLEANNNEWKDTFIPIYLDAGKLNDRYYAVSYQPVIETLYYNADLLKENGIEVPKSWDEMLEACKILKEKNIYGIGNWSGQNHQLMIFSYQGMANAGNLEDVTNGKVDFTTVDAFKPGLELIKTAYDNGYWYPGEGALVATKDQVQAAFYQGKVAMLFDAGSNVGTYQQECEFELGIMQYPTPTADSKYPVNVVTNALFIPSNAKHKEEAVKFVKYYTSDAGMAEIVKSGRLPSTVSMQDKVDNELMKTLLATTTGDNVVSYRQLQNLSSQINAYVQNDLIGTICTGTSIEDTLKQLEQLRLTATQGK